MFVALRDQDTEKSTKKKKEKIFGVRSSSSFFFNKKNPLTWQHNPVGAGAFGIANSLKARAGLQFCSAERKRNLLAN